MKNLKHYELPLFAQFEVSYSCNSFCMFCYNRQRQVSPPREITWKIAKVLHDSKIPIIQITGGECTLFPELSEIIKYLSEKSSVTIVTNGIKRVKLPDETAGVFVSLHGTKKTHEYLTRNANTYDKIAENIRHYVDSGLELSSDTLLCSKNYNEIYKIIENAVDLGMKHIVINRFEVGGMGTSKVGSLMPSVEQFRKALTQIIDARKDFDVSIIFGDSIPFCIDERLIKEGLAYSCSAGISYAVINPYGDLRICNQSNTSYGNVLERPLKEIWNNKSIDFFRKLKWVSEPCNKCPILSRCLCGCKVDNSCNPEYCIDFYMRGKKNPPKFVFNINEKNVERTKIRKYPRRFSASRFSKLQKVGSKWCLVTQYDVYAINEDGLRVMRDIFSGIDNESDLIEKNKSMGEENIKRFLGILFHLGAINKIGE